MTLWCFGSRRPKRAEVRFATIPFVRRANKALQCSLNQRNEPQRFGGAPLYCLAYKSDRQQQQQLQQQQRQQETTPGPRRGGDHATENFAIDGVLAGRCGGS